MAHAITIADSIEVPTRTRALELFMNLTISARRAAIRGVQRKPSHMNPNPFEAWPVVTISNNVGRVRLPACLPISSNSLRVNERNFKNNLGVSFAYSKYSSNPSS